jgi:tryptophanyl-tRNA synthetase
MRPTGPLHLGNFLGALDNWVRLQDEYECFFIIVDWHALTTDYADPGPIRDNIFEVACDWLAAGLDPARSALFVQSEVKEHAELHLLLSMMTPLSWLERVPSYKEQQQQLSERDLSTYGFLGYPLLQTADIIIYKANAVPVGEDQAPHVELTREIVRRFNNLYGPVFPEPKTLLTVQPAHTGDDGRKMSKSYGNVVLLKDPPDVVREKIRPMLTDPARKRRTDPGNPDICPVFDLHKAFSPRETGSGRRRAAAVPGSDAWTARGGSSTTSCIVSRTSTRGVRSSPRVRTRSGTSWRKGRSARAPPPRLPWRRCGR